MHLPPLKGLLPEHPSRTYPAVGRCIYCSSVDGLQDEHIIPLGLGGRYLLPKASCRRCGGKTSVFERTCQRTMYGPLRLLYGLPSRRKKDRPETLPLKVKRSAGSDWEYILVPQSRYPFLLTFPYLGMPGAMSGEVCDKGPVSKRLWIRVRRQATTSIPCAESWSPSSECTRSCRSQRLTLRLSVACWRRSPILSQWQSAVAN